MRVHAFYQKKTMIEVYISSYQTNLIKKCMFQNVIYMEHKIYFNINTCYKIIRFFLFKQRHLNIWVFFIDLYDLYKAIKWYYNK